MTQQAMKALNRELSHRSYIFPRMLSPSGLVENNNLQVSYIQFFSDFRIYLE